MVALPRRSNLFQDIVGIIHRHMAGNATVTESALLMNRTTGKEREVDVVIMGETAGHKVTIAVEATSRGRRADVPWVEQMLESMQIFPPTSLCLSPRVALRIKRRHWQRQEEP